MNKAHVKHRNRFDLGGGAALRPYVSTSAFSTRIWGIDAGRLPQTGPALRFLNIETRGELLSVPRRSRMVPGCSRMVPVRSGDSPFPAATVAPAAWLRATLPFPPVATAVTTRLTKAGALTALTKPFAGKCAHRSMSRVRKSTDVADSRRMSRDK